ncbi:MAG TPA: hypothetical protein VHJ78_00125 [Actinomycetota bacterium]|nr:hypothetical protein [Actinomycetota bacterium]
MVKESVAIRRRWLNPSRKLAVIAVTVTTLLAGLLAIVPGSAVEAGPLEVTSAINSLTGNLVTATNHLVPGDPSSSKFLLVWAGDENAADLTVNTLPDLLQRLGSSLDPNRTLDQMAPDLAPGQDFLAVVDADPSSSTYGKVVNTVTVGPLPGNEPHHMQYIWHKGDKIFAGGLFSAATYVFDVSELPTIKLSGASLPTDTLCGSVPDAYWTLSDGTAYGTYMGGPVIPGPCAYTNGETAVGNGFAGTPGAVVRFDQQGRVLSITKADTDLPVDRDPARCPGVPTVIPSCANPHGIQVREDLNRMITTDYAEPKNVVLDPLRPLSANLLRDTVRTWDITDRNNPRVVSVAAMPDGPRRERNALHEEPRGIMEGTVTNLPQHRGAFASSMCGGVIYYTPDITLNNQVWREVFDDTTAGKALRPDTAEGGGCDGGGWVQTSLDDRYLYHAVIGRNPGSLGPDDRGMPKMVYKLDISKLLASGSNPSCNIDTIQEVASGGAEADCPRLVDAIEIPDGTSGGPHWGALDNFVRNGDGTYSETAQARRFSTANYFVSRSTVDGNHKVCIVDDVNGRMSIDQRFIDENEGTPCVSFNRSLWPHGRTGDAKPHSQLFVVKDAALTEGAASSAGADEPAAAAPAENSQAASEAPSNPIEALIKGVQDFLANLF